MPTVLSPFFPRQRLAPSDWATLRHMPSRPGSMGSPGVPDPGPDPGSDQMSRVARGPGSVRDSVAVTHPGQDPDDITPELLQSLVNMPMTLRRTRTVHMAVPGSGAQPRPGSGLGPGSGLQEVGMDTVVNEGIQRLFTDGSTLHNGRRHATGGYAVVWEYRPDRTVAEPVRGGSTWPTGVAQWPVTDGTLPVTNQRCELLALLVALKDIMVEVQNGSSRLAHVQYEVYTDSEFVLHCLVQGPCKSRPWSTLWESNGYRTARGEPVANQDLLRPLVYWWSAARQTGRVKLRFVRAHTGGGDALSRGNAEADRLARAQSGI